MVVEDDFRLCHKRVLYFGTAVPTETSSGIDSVQKPLRERYNPNEKQIKGADAYLTVYPTGIKLQYTNDPETTILFPISALKLCAAVRAIDTINPTTQENVLSFISLNNPAAGGLNATRPAIFTAITRRTKGKKVLECHGFICPSPQDALELVKATSSADASRKGLPNGHIANHPTTLPRTNTSQNGPNIRLIAGDPISKGVVAKEFYDGVPEHGYFYKGPNTQIKPYNIEKLSINESKIPSRETTTPPPPLIRPPGPKSAPGSTTGAHTPRRVLRVFPPGRFMSPPPMGRSMYGGPPLPPHMADPYMYMNHAQFYDPNRKRSKRRQGSRSASRKKSGSRSHSPKERNGEAIPNGHAIDSSSEASSRPRTPPRDYPMYRLSRKEQHERSKRMDGDNYPEYPGFPYMMGAPYPMNVYATDYMPHPYYGYRARSVPPPLDRSPQRMSKKGKKKKGKKHKKGSHAPSDISTDSYAGYGSEVGPGMYDRVFGTTYPGIPRDFRNVRNQFQNEQAFSKSLLAENRKSDFPSAYKMNAAGDRIVERDGPEADALY